MSIKNNLTFVIVTYESDKVIDDCLLSIPDNYPVIIVENSGNENFKKKIEKKYSNVKCEIMNKNEGYCYGNNFGIKLSKTGLVFVLNPDVRLQSDTLEELDKTSNQINNFAILAPTLISNGLKEGFGSTKNYGFNNKTQPATSEFFEVDYIQGCALLLDKNRLKDIGFFDENIFMYYETMDLCKKVRTANKKIYICKKIKFTHYGASSVNLKFSDQCSLNRSWHYNWSKFYYFKKNFGYFFAIRKIYPNFLRSIKKMIICKIYRKKKEYLSHKNELLGILTSIFNRSSTYRPFEIE